MTINNLTEFVRSDGFRNMVEKQEQGIRFGFNLESAASLGKKQKLELYELDCKPALANGERIGPGPVIAARKFIPLMVGTDDLAFKLFSMKEHAEEVLSTLESDESIRRRSGSIEILHKRIGERDFEKNKFEHALLNLNSTINQIANGNYEFNRMEVYKGNVYD